MKPVHRPTDTGLQVQVNRRIADLERRITPAGSAIVTIAASNTAAAKRDLADYICTGTDDHQMVRQAFLDGYSNFLLLPGDFYFDDALDSPYAWGSFSDMGLDPRWWALRGHGSATVIHAQSTDGLIFTPGWDSDLGGELSNFAISIEATGTADVIGFGGSTGGRYVVRDLWVSCPDDTLNYQSLMTTRGPALVENITFGFFRTARFGINVEHGGAVVRNVLTTDGSYFGDQVIYVGTADRTQLLNATISGADCSDAAVVVHNSDDVLIQGCTLIDTGYGGGVDLRVDSFSDDIRLVGNLIGVEA